MTSKETQDYLELRHRLYGGGLDGEPGDIVTMKADIRSIKSTINKLDGAISFVKVASSFVGLGGLALFLRAVVGG